MVRGDELVVVAVVVVYDDYHSNGVPPIILQLQQTQRCDYVGISSTVVEKVT